MDKEVCWLITDKCNQNCQYCHRFLNIDNLTYEENKKILMKLINIGVTNITWSGGEAVLYPNIMDLLKIAKEHGIKNKLITNGVMLTHNQNLNDIYNYLDSLTLSIDAIDDDINEKMGRGRKHYSNIKMLLDILEKKNLKVNINTVVSKMNIDNIKELSEFLDCYNIYSWRIFKFIPLRETAKENQEKFEISKEEFESKKEIFQSVKNIKRVQYREENDMESKYILLIPNGDIVKTENGVDVIKGNALSLSLDEIIDIMKDNKKRNYTVDKIRTLIAHNNQSITDRIINSIKNLDYVEIVGTATNNREMYNKIINLQPEMVFAEYNMSDDMRSLDLMKLSEEKLEQKTPVFNMIAKNIPDNELNEALELIGNKMNSIIYEEYENRIPQIIEDYKEYKYKL